MAKGLISKLTLTGVGLGLAASLVTGCKSEENDKYSNKVEKKQSTEYREENERKNEVEQAKLEEAVKDEVKYGDLSNPKSALYTALVAGMKLDKEELEKISNITQGIDIPRWGFNPDLEYWKEGNKSRNKGLVSGIQKEFDEFWDYYILDALPITKKEDAKKLYEICQTCDENGKNWGKIDEFMIDFWKKSIEQNTVVEKIDENGILIRWTEWKDLESLPNKGENFTLMIKIKGDRKEEAWVSIDSYHTKEEAIKEYTKYQKN